MKLVRALRGTLLLSLLATLGGCGFHLQGRLPVSEKLALVRIDTDDRESDFYIGLRKALAAAGTRIDEDAADKDAAVIHVLADGTSDRTLVVSATNVPAEYEVTYKVKFSVSVHDRVLIAPEEHSLARSYSYTESEQLAKQRERSILIAALAHDLVTVLMRRLASL